MRDERDGEKDMRDGRFDRFCKKNGKEIAEDSYVKRFAKETSEKVIVKRLLIKMSCNLRDLFVDPY